MEGAELRLQFLSGEEPASLTPHIYRLNRDVEEGVAEQVEEWRSEGVVAEASAESPYCLPLLAVRKIDRTLRVCLDTRALNILLKPMTAPLPTTAGLIESLGSARIFSQLDLKAAFLQLPVHRASRKFLTFSSGGRLWSFQRAPFGIKVLSALFQSVMTRILRGLPVLVYIDNVVVATLDVKAHWSIVLEVLKRVNLHGIKLNPKKCEWAKTTLKVLGVEISGGAVRPDPDKVIAVRAMARPGTVVELMSFNGVVNYLRPFLPDAAVLMQPLHQLASGSGGKHRRLAWTPEAEAGFGQVKEMMARLIELQRPAEDSLLFLYTDASGYGVGAAIGSVVRSGKDGRRIRNVEELKTLAPAGELDPRGYHFAPIALYSATFKSYERRWSVTRKELAAVVWALRHFAYYLLGRMFILRTDHKSLCYSLFGEASATTVQHWLSIIGEYQFDIQHVEGHKNVLADALSRHIAVGGVRTAAASIAAEGAAAASMAAAGNGVCAVVDPGEQELPDEADRPGILDSAHQELIHASAHLMVAHLLSLRISWPSMESDARRHVLSCIHCLRHNSCGKRAPKAISLVATQPWQWVQVDTHEFSVPSFEGKTTTLILIDVFSLFMMALSLIHI